LFCLANPCLSWERGRNEKLDDRQTLLLNIHLMHWSQTQIKVKCSQLSK
jgi:hypothetical protein